MQEKIMIIRKEEIKDYSLVEELTKKSFEKAGLSEVITEHILLQKLRNSKGFIPELSLVAEENDEIVGHIILTKIVIKTENKETETLCLAPMSVKPEVQKMGIGSKLIQESLAIAKNMGFGSVIVLGHKEYYPKFGFIEAKNYGLSCEFDVPDEYFFALELKSGSLKNIKGIVCYPDVFKE